MKILILTVLLLLLSPAATAKAIQTEEGIAGIAVVIEAADELPDPVEVITAARQAEIEQYIEEYSTLYDIDADLTRAIIQVESDGVITAFNVNSNGSRDYGLMQINDCNHEWLETELGITDWYDPRQNIRAGCYILGQLHRQYDGNLHKVLMAYNMGPSRMMRLWRKGIRSSSYSRKVVKILNQIKEVNIYEINRHCKKN
jgi:soluble lytic murein transglycosylase-like protein